MRLITVMRSSAFVVSIGAATSCFAQSVPAVTDPGRLQKGIQGSTKPALDASPIAAPSLPAVPRSSPPKGAESATFVLNSISFEGASVYSDAELSQSFKDKIGQKVSVSDVFDIAAILTARYRNDGFLLSSVIVPPQEIGDDGNITLKVVEGFIDRIEVKGVSSAGQRTVEGYLNGLVNLRPLTKASLERHLLLANDLPGVSLKSFLQPSPQNGGAAVLTIEVEQSQLNAWTRADMRGSEFVGPIQHELGLTFSGLPSLDQSLTIRGIYTPESFDELNYIDLAYTNQLGVDGFGVSLSVSGLRSKPGKNLRDIDLKSESIGFNAGVEYKAIREREQNLVVSFSAAFQNAETQSLGADLTEDKNRSLRLGGSYQFSDKFSGVTSVSVAANQGLEVLGATKSGDTLLTRADADPDVSWFDASVSRRQALMIPGMAISAAVRGQYSLGPQTAGREFGVGGTANGSAFDSGEIIGDHGVSGRVELSYSSALPGIDESPIPEVLTNLGLQVYGFADGGSVWQADQSGTTQSNDSIASAGVGLRLNLGDHISTNIEVAKPFLKDVDSKGDRDPRLFFELVGRF